MYYRFLIVIDFTATQPQSHNIGGAVSAAAQILPSNNLAHSSIAHSNAGSPAVFIASGSCIEQNTKVRWKSSLFVRLFSLLIFDSCIHPYCGGVIFFRFVFVSSMPFPYLAIIQLNCTVKKSLGMNAIPYYLYQILVHCLNVYINMLAGACMCTRPNERW